MDILLELADNLILDEFYAAALPKRSSFKWPSVLGTTNHTLEAKINNPLLNFLDVSPYMNESLLPRDNIVRQTLSLYVITVLGAYLVYFFTSAASYYFVYSAENFKHPKYLKNQLRMEVMQSIGSIPLMTLFTIPWFLAEARGYSRLYWSIDTYPTWYFWLQFPFFILFTDCLVYCIHRALHSRLLYKRFHKPHHKWIVPTPFASFAFHPVDGYLQSLPYHIFPFFFPLQKLAYLVLFTLVQMWTVIIHDGEYLANDPVINGAACHTIHHLYFNYNYGQYTTLWDRLGGSYRTPDRELFDKSKKMTKSTWSKQSETMETIRKTVEGDVDDRTYIDDKKSR
jgi:Delta7-sterol 5-desaturase